MGGGPYRFVSYTGGTLTLEANAHYWKGQPQIRYIQFREGQEADKLSGITAGTLDITDPAYSTQTAQAIQKANGGELSGAVMQTVLTPNPGYGYIGINAKNVSVGGEPGSDASKNLRKALATVIAVYRDVAVDSYYGAFGNVIHYPISDTSWAAPRPTDPGYRQAFSLDKDGKPIYTPEMTAQQRYEAAKKASLEYLIAAGYTGENGKITAAPAGANMSYEVLIGAGGTGDHPTFMVLTMASAALKEIGFDLIVTDVSNFSELTNAVNAGTAELFAMAWTASADPDLYQIYHSRGGSNEKSYSLKDPKLDELILLARNSSDQTYRKTIYKECLERIADWAVEIPVYQRQNSIIFSTKRVDMSTVTPDITAFWGWENDIEKLQMK
jgi:peptide/nickel transport system substrate-binding protein